MMDSGGREVRERVTTEREKGREEKERGEGRGEQ